MSKRKSNGDTTVVDGEGTGQEAGSGKVKPQPRMVRDPFSNELRPENKEEKFHRLAEQRVTHALKRLSQVKNLGNRSQYEYTEEQANKILAALQGAVNEIRASLSGNRAIVQGFRL